jgi:hypothetical protein
MESAIGDGVFVGRDVHQRQARARDADGGLQTSGLGPVTTVVEERASLGLRSRSVVCGSAPAPGGRRRRRHHGRRCGRVVAGSSVTTD